jgi:hypothetical protein
MITNAISGPILFDTGQRTSMLTALSVRERKSVFSGPRASLQNPHMRRPRAEEKLKAATTPAPTLDFMPSESVYSGRKKGGTSRGKVAIAPTRKRRVKRTSRKRCLCCVSSDIYEVERLTTYHSMIAALGMGVRSLMKRAAGIPVARVIKPSALNVQAMPVF